MTNWLMSKEKNIYLNYNGFNYENKNMCCVNLVGVQVEKMLYLSPLLETP